MQEGLKKGWEPLLLVNSFTTSCRKQLFSSMNYKKVSFPGRAPEVWWYSQWVLFGWGDEAGLGRVQPKCWNWTVHHWEGAAHTHLYGLMRGHGQIYLERESTDTRLEFTIVLTDILTLIIHIWKAFVGIVSHSAFTWHTSQTQVSKWRRIFFPTIRLALTMNSCIKLTESKQASHVPLGNSFSIKGALFSVRLLGEVLRSNRDPAGHCPKPLAASAFPLPVMHLGAMWVPGRCGACDVSGCSLVQAWRWTGVSLTGLQLYSPKQN